MKKMKNGKSISQNYIKNLTKIKIRNAPISFFSEPIQFQYQNYCIIEYNPKK